MEEVHGLYIILQCTTLDRLCNAMQNVISLVTFEGVSSGAQCNAISTYMLFFNAQR